METLEQRFSYEKDPERIRDIFLELDHVMHSFHNKGYVVEVRPSKIVYSDDMFVFSSFSPELTEDGREKNITDLAKLAAGTYYSIPTTFMDYTKVSNDYLREHYDPLQMDSAILKATEGDSYYRDVIVEGKNNIYYNDYLVHLKEAQSRNRTNTKSVVKSLGTYGKPNTIKEDPAMGIPKDELSNRQAAFIDIVFYPIILAVFAIMAYAFMILIRVL